MKYHIISPEKLSFEKIEELLNNNYLLKLSDESKKRIVHCRNYLDKKIKKETKPIYGITTGFGSLHNCIISKKDLTQLQENLVMSHACGTGEYVPKEIIKIMLLLKIHALSLGMSGVQLKTIERLIDFYNHDILPVIYEQGSLGASGDLSPLAHLTLPLLGMGEVYYQNKIISASEVLKKFNWSPIQLASKEGLALLNGTQFMSSYGVYILLRSFKISKLADIIAATSIDAYDGRLEPFFLETQQVRPHIGQAQTSKNIQKILKGSEIIKQPKEHIQDPYSFRCIPQVHGATKDAINHTASIFLIEINAVTDNPIIFPDKDLIISGGNFHGQPLALAFDFLSMALAELGNISERRIYRLISGYRKLPEFLVSNPGLNSGFMIPQYTAASIVSQNKQLCTPACVDSIPSSNEQEDHVSMGANAATKSLRILNNIERILAIEFFTAAQALEFRKPLKTSPFLQKIINQYRTIIPFINEDRVMYYDIERTIQFITSLKFNEF